MKKKFLLLIVALLAIATTACSKKEVEAGIVTEAAGVDWTQGEINKVDSRVESIDSRMDRLQDEINELLNGETPIYLQVFNDVTTDYWAFKEIMTLYNKQLISGYTAEKLFKPEQSITRAQAATMLVKALKLPLSDSPSTFTDIKDDMWARKAIMTVAERGYFKGSNGKFMPNDPMKRKHMAVVLQRAYQLQPISGPFQDYKDVPATDDGYIAIKAVTQNEIATGSNGNFMPYESTKRSQFSVFLYRAMLK
ncbi:S-layer homology domain-containing protein [Neobacillus sp. D3-1R]|uniref:S-layer homology domain-containing protein n=1 Tax=Neobacillus sp. D3-1R TaxID=3445778 RepID=UPI003FA148EA